MSLFYEVAYRIGFTPWEHASETRGGEIAALLDVEELERGRPPGRALDLGCGSGYWTIELSRRGWSAVGIDNVPKALGRARARAAAAGVGASFIHGSVTALRQADVGDGYSLLLDVGCFHGLTDSERADMAREVNAVSASDAVMLLLAFTPARRGPLPRGASAEELEIAFAGWRIVSEHPMPADALPGPLQKADPRVYRLRRVA